MRITTYRVEIGNDLCTNLIKEKSFNYKCESFNKANLIVDMMNQVFALNRRAEEYLYMVAFNTKCKPIGIFELSHGTANQSFCNPREIFNRLCLCGATSFVLLHNHPSGDPAPSQSDFETYKRIKECSILMGIDLLDNIIVGKSYYSFTDNNIE